uniref:Protein PHLOEM PROTEIN 2-LIKE A1 n=1 Tax=Aegilops tauschii TaxID=37682 RepID=N1QS40_AEGTA
MGNSCFMLLPRGLSIAWAEEPSYWAWLPPSPGEGSAGAAAGEEVAELKNVWSLEVHGKLDLSQLTPEVTYEVAFEVMLKQGCAGWQVPVDLQLELPGAWAQGGKESLEKKARGQWLPLKSLEKKARGQWLPLKVGNVEVEKGQQGGELLVTMSQDGGHWKSGLVVRGIRIAPKN